MLFYALSCKENVSSAKGNISEKWLILSWHTLRHRKILTTVFRHVLLVLETWKIEYNVPIYRGS